LNPMIRSPHRAVFAGVLSIALLLPVSSLSAESDSSLANEADEEPLDLAELREEREKQVLRMGVRDLTAKRMTAAIEFLEENQDAEARAKLESMNLRRLNGYERALIYRLIAYACFGTEDFECAVDNFQKAIAEAALPLDEEVSVRFNVVQLYGALEEWRKVIETLHVWFRYVEEPNPLAYYLLAISHFQLEEYEVAIAPAVRAIELSAEPREGWLQLLVALHLQLLDYENAVPVLEQLVTLFPKKQYWVQLSLLYGARDDYETAFSIQQLAYAQGLLTEDSELRRLARSYLYHQLPEPAARILEKELAADRIESDREVLELLGNSWIAAREFGNAVEPLRKAAMLSDDGKLYLRLAQVHVQREEWKEAASLLQKALEKGGLNDPGKAHVLLGICYFSDDQPGRARSAFVRAQSHDSTREEAKAWIEHIRRETSLGESLAQDTRESRAPEDRAAAGSGSGG
jgi:tetratricopeptide (TPR) repeat protein